MITNGVEDDEKQENSCPQSSNLENDAGDVEKQSPSTSEDDALSERQLLHFKNPKNATPKYEQLIRDLKACTLDPQYFCNGDLFDEKTLNEIAKTFFLEPSFEIDRRKHSLVDGEIIEKTRDVVRLRIEYLCDKYCKTGRALYRALAMLWESARRKMTIHFAYLVDFVERGNFALSLLSVEKTYFIRHIKEEIHSQLDDDPISTEFEPPENYKEASFSRCAHQLVACEVWRTDRLINSFLMRRKDLAKEAAQKPESSSAPKEAIEDPFKIFANLNYNLKMNLNKFFKNNKDATSQIELQRYMHAQKVTKEIHDSYGQEEYVKNTKPDIWEAYQELVYNNPKEIRETCKKQNEAKRMEIMKKKEQFEKMKLEIINSK